MGKTGERPEKKQMTQYERMTEEAIPKLIIALSIPTVLSMLVSNIYNLVDTAFVGRLGTSQSAAVGVIFGYMSIIQAVGFMLARARGASRRDCSARRRTRTRRGSPPPAFCAPSDWDC